MRRFKITILLLVVLVSISSLASAQDFTEWLREASKPYQGVTINMIGEALPPLEALDQLKNGFTEITGINVIIEQRAIDQVTEKTRADFIAKTGIYDCFLNPHVNLAQNVENQWLEPLETFIQNNAINQPGFDITEDIANKDWLNACFAYKGKLYALPFSVHTIFYEWRKDLFDHSNERQNFKEKYGYELPSPAITMDQLKDCAEFFTRKKGELMGDDVLEHDVYGMTLSGKRHISMLWNFFNVLYSFNGQVIDSPTGDDYGEIVINSQEGINALTYYKEMIDNYCPPGSTTYTWDEQLAAIQSGVAVQSLLWADAAYAITEDETQSKVIGKVAYSGIPIAERKSANLHGWGMSIPKTSKNPEAAWLFLQWTQRPEIQAELMANGSISLSESAYQHPSVYNLTYSPTHYFITHRKVLEIDGKDTFLEPDDKGKVWGLPREYYETPDPTTGDILPAVFKLDRFPEHVVMDDILQKYINACLAGQYEPKEALDKAVAEVKAKIPKLQ